MSKITVGHDGEVFLRNINTREFVSAVGLIGGSKKNPLPIPHMPKGFALQEDNVAVEFNIPPATEENEFVAYCSSALYEIRRRAQNLGLEVAIEPSAVFPEDQLQTPQAMTGGCEPDLDAWSGKQNMPPELFGRRLRSSGGHVHIGGISGAAPAFLIARACDLFISVPMAGLDKDMERRKLYGHPGAFRMTSYGMEYRTLSNFWLRSPNLMGYVFRGVQRAVTDATNWMNNRGPSPDYLVNIHPQIEGIFDSELDEATRLYYRKGLMSNYKLFEPVF